ncbi:MAG: nucleotide pyrophosphohydrolase [Candidatus Woesearchaeota archaeon]
MTLKNLQEEVDKWAQQFKKPYWEPLSMFARLAEEIGEVARELNHLYGDKKKRVDTEKNLGDELVDVIFTNICIANREKIDLEKFWDKMMKEKHYGRDNNRYEKK